MRKAGVLVIQFARWPEPGRVKTRLASSMGVLGALDAHIELTMATLNNLMPLANQTNSDLELWWDRPAGTQEPAMEYARPILDLCRANRVGLGIQQSNDLGARMMHALMTGLRRYETVVLVGSDCPSVCSNYVAEAAQRLQRFDTVLGPADDGGFVLFGARRVAGQMFDDVEWGSGRVLAQTSERLENSQLSYDLLDFRWDVDTADDWQRWRRSVSSG